ncbi:hypothetical protein ebA3282 [Aromatoleum aromaticum EbN1]|uniref:Uncharacterized protein n=1 Tax=Aromatoleum aromaticum (strain DSM 19018 / LMG 30748 / EbN1) TaxID=76114 RepID=Q5P3Z2_AROAE|nr:hypothetical protein ebA3282 [Aromatoleum aromaticum EbN1]
MSGSAFRNRSSSSRSVWCNSKNWSADCSTKSTSPKITCAFTDCPIVAARKFGNTAFSAPPTSKDRWCCRIRLREPQATGTFPIGSRRAEAFAFTRYYSGLSK